MKKPIILATFNNKGGVAKTTYAGLIGLHLASENKKVLLIDGDPQSNLTSRLYAFSHNNKTLGDLLLNANTTKLRDGIIRGFIPEYSGLDIIPANREMKYLEEVLLGIDDSTERDFVIAKWIMNNIEDIEEYDYVIWDISPSISILGRNILNTCDKILFVSEYNNIDSIEAVAKFINEYTLYRFNYGLEAFECRVLINKYKKSPDAEKYYEPFENCLEVLKGKILSTKMIESSIIRNCCLYKKDLVSHTMENKLNKKAMNLFVDIINELKEVGII